MDVPCLYHHDSILLEHSYSLPTSSSCTHNNELWCQEPSSNQSLTYETEVVTSMSIESLFQHNAATPSLHWNWRYDVDDSEVNFVGTVEEVLEDKKVSSTDIIAGAPVIANKECQNTSNSAYGTFNLSNTLLPFQDDVVGNANQFIASIQHEREVLPDIQCHAFVQNMDSMPGVCARGSHTTAQGNSLGQKVSLSPVPSGIAADSASHQSESSAQFGYSHSMPSDKILRTPPFPATTSFQEYVKSMVADPNGTMLSCNSQSDVPERDKNSSKEHTDLIDILSITSDPETEFVHSENIEYHKHGDMRANNSSITKPSNFTQEKTFTDMTEFSNTENISGPPLCDVSKNSDTSDTESSTNSRQDEIDMRLKQGFFCQICRELCETVSILKKHIRYNHSPCDLVSLPALYQEIKCSLCKVEYFMCLYCCRTYFSIKKIIDHCGRHRTRSCFRCSVCSVKFFMSDRWHLLDHDIKPCCSICRPDASSSGKFDLHDSSSGGNDFQMELEHPMDVEELEGIESVILPDDGEPEEIEADFLSNDQEPEIEPDNFPDVEDSDEMEPDLLEDFMIDEVKDWDPVVVLYRLSTASNSEDKELAPLASDYQKCTRSIPPQHNDTVESKNPISESPRTYANGGSSLRERLPNSLRGKTPKSERNSSVDTERGATLRKKLKKNSITETSPIGHKTDTTRQTISAHHSTIDEDRGSGLQKRHKCEHCGQSFLQKDSYLQHIEMQHDYEIDHPNKSHHCHKCEKKFAYYKALPLHVRGHYLERRRCEYCKKLFFDERKLLTHRCVKL